MTLTLDPSQLTKTIDKSVLREQSGLPRQYKADASGLIVLTSGGIPNLRVPVYSAPRPASVMTQPASLTLPSGGNQKALLPLSGQPVDQGSGKDNVQSLVAGFELQRESQKLPRCFPPVTSNCITIPEERDADLKYVGATSDAPQLRSIGDDPIGDGLTYIAVSNYAPWRTAMSMVEYDIYIDTNGDNKADLVAFNGSLDDTSDVPVSVLIDLTSGDVLDEEIINGEFGDVDTALFDSDTLVIPIYNGALGVTPSSSRISYSILSFTATTAAPIDNVGGLRDNLKMKDPMTLDVLHPGVSVAGSFDGNASPLLFRDSPGSVLALTRNKAAYAADGGLGALMVHFQNVVGDKAQVVRLGAHTKTVVASNHNPSKQGQKVTFKATVTSESVTPTGRVTFYDGKKQLGSRLLSIHGVASLTTKDLAVGDHAITASYAGKGDQLPSTSKVRIQKVKPA